LFGHPPFIHLRVIDTSAIFENTKRLTPIMGNPFSKSSNVTRAEGTVRSAILYRNVTKTPLTVTSHDDNWLQLNDCTSVYDASGGPAVSSFGRKYKKRMWAAMGKVLFEIADYIPSLSYTTRIEKDLSVALINTTKGLFSKVIFYSSGKFQNREYP
jgi:adenosylmethionine-8-amino-7-oxononanoate aminotransferase